MALVQMWPPNDGSRNAIFFDGRTYSGVPGSPVQVQDFDVPVLEANGWTTHATMAGKITITMLPPADAVHNQIAVNMRTYKTSPGGPIEVQPFDAPVLNANNWAIIWSMTLQTLTLSASSFHVGDPQGTVVGTILGASTGSTITFNSLNPAGALQIAGTSLQVGPTPSGSPATVTFNLIETFAGATNTPNQTNGFSVSELVAIPVNTVAPTITGTAQVGQLLTGHNGTWTGSPTFTYQWYGAGIAIGGATSITYVPVAGDIGNTLTIWVTGTNAGGSSAPATSAATSAVVPAGAVPVNTALPVISGTAQNGQTLTTTNGTWTNSPTSFTFQWKSAGVNATGAGATTASYSAVAADVGNTLAVAIIATNGGGSSAPATSAATGTVIDIIPTNTVLPSISGSAVVGSTLTAANGTWTHNPTSLSYQWNDTISGAISGATSSTYIVAIGQLNHPITVSVVATNSGGSSTAATSAATASVAVVLQTLTLSANSFTVGDLQGTQVGNVQNTTAGSTVTFNSLSVAGSLQLANVGGVWKVQVGPTVPGSPTGLTFNLVETLSGGSNSPKTTSGFTVNENASGSGPALVSNLDMRVGTVLLAA